MVCAYDEFGDIARFDPKGNLIKLFRSKIQHHTHSAYIFSGSYESVMQNLFVTVNSPFHRFARIIKLKYLDEKPLHTYLSTRFSDIGINVPDNYSQEMIHFTKCHPYYTQLALQQIALINTLEGNIPSIDELSDHMLSLEKDYLEKIWEGISGNREYVHTLRAIAENGKNIYTRLKPRNINVSRATKSLEGMGLLFKNEKTGYYIADPLFRLWIMKNL